MNNSSEKRSGIFQVFFWLFVFSDLIAVWNAIVQPTSLRISQEITGSPAWLSTGRGLLSIVALISLYGIWKWKKWGLYGYLAGLILSYLLTILGSGSFSPVFLILGIGFQYLLYWGLIAPKISNYK